MSEKNDKELYLNFDEYIRQGDPQKKERAEAWRVAIGLQAVDGLKVSGYLLELARRNIEGEISMEEVNMWLTDFQPKGKACIISMEGPKPHRAPVCS